MWRFKWRRVLIPWWRALQYKLSSFLSCGTCFFLVKWGGLVLRGSQEHARRQIRKGAVRVVVVYCSGGRLIALGKSMMFVLVNLLFWKILLSKLIRWRLSTAWPWQATAFFLISLLRKWSEDDCPLRRLRGVRERIRDWSHSVIQKLKLTYTVNPTTITFMKGFLRLLLVYIVNTDLRGIPHYSKR